MWIWLGICVGAALGAPLRFFTDRITIARWGTSWPYGTFIVNISGSLILGLLTGLTTGVANGTTGEWAELMAFAGTGFCGALTTFGGFSSQVLELSRRPLRLKGTLYGAASLICGFVVAMVGYMLTISI